MNLLAGDLGGTKTILAIYSNEDYPKKLFEKYYISSEWKSFYSIFEDFIKLFQIGSAILMISSSDFSIKLMICLKF